MKRRKFQQIYTAGLFALLAALLVACAPEGRLQKPEKGTEQVAAFTNYDYLQAKAQGKIY